MAELSAEAGLITPNLTEAALLLGEDYRNVPTSQAGMEQWLSRLSLEGKRSVVITGVSFAPKTIGAGCFDHSRGRIHFAMARQEAASFYGTGDLFAAVLLGGFLLTNLSLGQPSVSSYLAPFMLEENLRLVGQYLAGFFCIIGHLFPLYFGFRGGKGVLTTLGMMLILDWKVALLSLLMFIIVVLFSRMVSLGSICAAATMAVLTYVFRMFVYKQDASTVIFCTCMAVLIAAILIIKHIPNIKRIAKGTESKLSFGKK